MTIEKLRYLLSKATALFGDRKTGELTSQEIAQWRMNLSPGYRFEATQALRQVLHRAVAWGMLDVNPAKVGVDKPARRRKEQHPFESWAALETVAAAIGPRYGPMILFAAATGLRQRNGSPSRNATSTAKHESSTSGARSREASSRPRRRRRARERYRYRRGHSTRSTGSTATARRSSFPESEAATSTSTTSAHTSGGQPRNPRASTRFAGVYDLRHTFATFALRAGISTFDLSRYMGASLTMIDRHYGHLARDGREHAIKLLDALNEPRSQEIPLGVESTGDGGLRDPRLEPRRELHRQRA